MELLNKSFTPFIPESDILKRIKELAAEISSDYADKDPIFVVILNGAFLFAADLIKEIKIPCRVSFIKVASYAGMETTGRITNLIGLTENLKDQNVILLDDIVDTGLTMQKVINDISSVKPASISVSTLLVKPESFHNQFPLNYVGFSIPHKFVVGYGLDYDGYGRNLKDIYVLNG